MLRIVSSNIRLSVEQSANKFHSYSFAQPLNIESMLSKHKLPFTSPIIGSQIRKKNRIIDGKALASLVSFQIKSILARTNLIRETKANNFPSLACVLVGNNPDSKRYVNHKKKACLNSGIIPYNFELSEDITQERLENLIYELNQDPKISGIMVQFPLPMHLSESRISEIIAPEKDVDGLHPLNISRIFIYE